MVESFEELDVFQRSYRISLDIHSESLKWPQIEQYALGDQVRRASKSIPANIAEGFGKQRSSTREFRRYLVIALGSADERRVWRHWSDEYKEIAKMLQGLINSLGINSDP